MPVLPRLHAGLGLLAGAALALGLPGTASAAEPLRPVAGLRLGAALSWSPGTAAGHLVPEVEVGAWDRRGLLVLASAAYGAPGGTGSLPPDPRLPGDGVTHWTGTWHRFSLGVSGGWRFAPRVAELRPYLLGGPRFLWVRRHLEAEAGGVPFAPTAERAVAIGLTVQGGVERPVGPGHATLEGQLGWAAPSDGVLPEGSRTLLGLFAGYRLYF